MKHVFSLTLLVSTLAATRTVFAMEAGEHDKLEITGLGGKQEETSESNETNRLIEALKGTYGMHPMLTLIGQFALWNAERAFPLDPKLKTLILRHLEGQLKDLKAAYRIAEELQKNYPMPSASSAISNKSTEHINSSIHSVQNGTLSPKHITLLNELWTRSQQNGNRRVQLEHHEEKIFELLPTPVQKAAKRMIKQPNWLEKKFKKFL